MIFGENWAFKSSTDLNSFKSIFKVKPHWVKPIISPLDMYVLIQSDIEILIHSIANVPRIDAKHDVEIWFKCMFEFLSFQHKHILEMGSIDRWF